MSRSSFDTSRTPSDALMITYGSPAMNTTMIGPCPSKPNQIATSRPQIRYGNVSPTTTKSCSSASTLGDMPIASPTTLPTTSASTNPSASRPKLIEKASTTVPSTSSAHISSATSAGLGRIREGIEGAISCQASRNSRGAVILAPRLVMSVRRTNDRLLGTARPVPRGASMVVSTLTSASRERRLPPPEEASLEPLEDESLHDQGEPDEEERPCQDAGDAEELELDAHLPADPRRATEELGERGDLPRDREAVPDGGEQERRDRRDHDVPQAGPSIDRVRRGHVVQLRRDRAHALDHVYRHVRERRQDD